MFTNAMIKFFNPGSLCVDSLAFSWIGETCWLVPPVSLVKIVIRHVCYCPCRGILVIPYWPLAPFGPLLVQSGEFSNRLLLISFTLRTVNTFISTKKIKISFLAQRILVPQYFFCCLTGFDWDCLLQRSP